MADYLVIVESPAKAKTIEKYLGKKYKVTSSMGHIRDLPKSQMGIDVNNNYAPHYITIRGKGDLAKQLKKEAKKAKKIFLASDPDREGEAIAWHLSHLLDPDNAKSSRVVFNEITKDAVKEAFKHPRDIDMNVVDAQQGRRILDRLVGYNISPVLWKKVKKGLSAGRVQTVAVKLIIDRENEINNFKPEEYWSVTGQFIHKRKKFYAKLLKVDNKSIKLQNEAQVKEVLSTITSDLFEVTNIKATEKKRFAALPFTTSSLQQEAARKLNFKARKTMMIAQQLYEGIDLKKQGGVTGLITYMRTDSTRISDVAKTDATKLITDKYGSEYLLKTARKTKKSSNTQDAHEAIRPTQALREPAAIKDYLSRDQFKLYKLIWERFIASQMAPAIFDTVAVDLTQERVMFRANGSTMKFAGFMKLYVEGADDEVDEENTILPDMVIGDKIKSVMIKPEQHFTQPPPRYTEARLVKTLEESGIGRPSTYAPTLDTIQKRNYVKLEQKRFVPTELGTIVIELVDEYFPEITKVDFTANMEFALDKIADGKVAWIEVIDAFYKNFEQHVHKAEEEMEKIVIKDEPTGEACEKCGSDLVYKMGRYGKFIACSNFPDCRNAKPIIKEIGLTCPTCHQGKIVERKSKKGRIFYGCSDYPTCEFVSWDKPLARSCPKCQSYLVEKVTGKKVQVQCSKCDFKEKQQ